VAAVQPMRGGMAPTTAPTHVFEMLTTLRGVYTAAYSAMLAAPNPAVKPFVCRENVHKSTLTALQPCGTV